MRWFVKSTGDDNNSGETIDQAFATLQKALEVAADGDEIIILDNIVNTSDIILPNKSLIIRGHRLGYYPLTDGESRPSSIQFKQGSVMVFSQGSAPIVIEDLDFIFDSDTPSASGADILLQSGTSFCYHKTFQSCMISSYRNNPVVNLNLSYIGLMNFYNVHIQSYTENECLILTNITGVFADGLLTQHVSASGDVNPHVLLMVNNSIPKSFIVRESSFLFVNEDTGYTNYIFVSDNSPGIGVVFDKNTYALIEFNDLTQSKYFTSQMPSGAKEYDPSPSEALFTYPIASSIMVSPPGIYNVTISTKTAGGSGIPFTMINVLNDQGKLLHEFQTDQNGNASITLNQGTYHIRAYAVGYTFTESIVNITQDTQIDLTGSEIYYTPSPDPALCRIHIYVKDFGLQPRANIRVYVDISDLPQTIGSNIGVLNTQTFLTDANGYVYFDVAQGATITVNIPDARLKKEFTVPLQSSLNLADIV